MKKNTLLLLLATYISLLTLPLAYGVDEEKKLIKISVVEKGIYKITYPMLKKAGLDISKIDPRKINISNKDTFIPIRIEGEEDGSFDREDYIEFYGTYNQGQTTTTDRYSEANVYMLSWDNKKPVRFEYDEVTESKLKKDIESEYSKKITFRKKIHFEKDVVASWRFPHPRGEETDFAFWYWLDMSRNDFVDYFDLPGYIKDSPVTFKMKNYGITHLLQNPDHHIILYINDKKIGDIWWDDSVQYIYTNNKISPSCLKENKNKIRIKVGGDIKETEGKKEEILIDQSFLDWFEVEYVSDNYVPKGYLDIEALPDPQKNKLHLVTFKNIPSNNVEIFDILDNKVIKPFTFLSSDVMGKKCYNTYFLDEINRVKQYIVITEEKKIKPKKIEQINLKNLSSKNNSAQLVIITHKSFWKAAERLSDWKSKNGFKTTVVDINDVYNEFNGGVINPVGIKKFLKYAYENWKEPKPKYVLLMGDTSWDVKNLSSGTYHVKNYIPTFYFQPSDLLEFASDNWFVCFNNEKYLPRMAIGRFPVETLTQAQDIVNKVIAYEKNPTNNDWRRHFLTMASNEENFKNKSNEVIKDIIPPYFISTKVYRGEDKNASKNIKNAFNKGVFVTLFSGHGGADLWAGGEFFTVEMADKLKNNKKYPITLTATCFSGTFDNSLKILGIGEKLLRSPKSGSIAVMGTAWRSRFDSDFRFSQEILKKIFYEHYTILGNAFLDVKREINNEEVSESFILLGDPTLKISFPPLNVDIKVDNNILIGNTYKLFGTVDKKINGNAEIKLIDTNFEMIFHKTVEVKNGEFNADVNIPLIGSKGNGSINVYVWTDFPHYLDGATVAKVNLLYRN